MATTYEPISLGGFCEAKYQIIRHMYFKEFPDRTHLSLRMKISVQDHGEQLYGWHLFDWQTTPTDTVIRYLENDFEEIFEREDLVVHEGRTVLHRRLHTDHLHDFERDQAWTDERLDSAYPSARRHFEKRVREFREILNSPGPYLYVHLAEDMPDQQTVQRLLDLLAARSPAHQFHLLIIAADGVADASPFEGRASFAARRGSAREDVAQTGEWWAASVADWEVALSSFTLVRPGQRPAPPDSPLLAAHPQAKTKTGLFGLFGRRA